jgi:hypothetical protein
MEVILKYSTGTGKCLARKSSQMNDCTYLKQAVRLPYWYHCYERLLLPVLPGPKNV